MQTAEQRRPPSLIVAEEDDLDRRRLRIILESSGARIHEAVDCWEVMSLLLSTGDPVDLVISDLGALRAIGLDVLVWARAAGIDVPFLFLTTGSSLAMHVRAARLGARVLQKPLDATELLNSVEQMCGPPRQRGGPGPHLA